MKNIKSFQQTLNKISESAFDNHAIRLFQFQASHNPVYKNYLHQLGVAPAGVRHLRQIPFLPIEFFKYHPVKTGHWQPQTTFISSGTTGQQPSQHALPDLAFYHRHARYLFEQQFGPLAGKVIVALLPAYLERQGSSLVSMVDYFIRQSQNSKSGFYLHNHDALVSLLQNTGPADEVFLFGVTFALLDLAENYRLNLGHVTLVETGGMKGRREEIIKDELYAVLQQQLGVVKIYAEYGMTELLSQAYGQRGRFPQSTAMRVLIRDINDPFALLPAGKTGGINIIDLANVHSCAFIETKDLGRVNADGSFEVLGRFDNADLRGCNLLVS